MPSKALIMSARVTGFNRYCSTPSSIALRAYSKSLYPLMMMIFVLGSSPMTILQSDRPSMKGIVISVIMTSGFNLRIMGSAISPSGASPTNSNPYFSHGIISRNPSRTMLSSSQIKTLMLSICFSRSPGKTQELLQIVHPGLSARLCDKLSDILMLDALNKNSLIG